MYSCMLQEYMGYSPIERRLDLGVVRRARRAAVSVCYLDEATLHLDRYLSLNHVSPNDSCDVPIRLPDFCVDYLISSPGAVNTGDRQFNTSKDCSIYHGVSLGFGGWLYSSELQNTFLPGNLIRPIGIVRDELKIENQRQFWSFFRELNKGSVFGVSHEMANVSLSPLLFENLSHWADLDQAFYISANDLNSLWQEATESCRDGFASIYGFVSALRSALIKRVDRLARVRIRIRRGSRRVGFGKCPSTHTWVLSFSLHTGSSPPEKGEAICFIFAQLEDSHAAVRRCEDPRRIRRRVSKERARPRRDESCASAGYSCCREQSRRGAVRRSWTNRKTAPFKAA